MPPTLAIDTTSPLAHLTALTSRSLASSDLSASVLVVVGAQRVHDVALLEERCAALGVPVEGLKTYIDAFRYGALPHG
jgi:aspartyl/asparaginyl-tRNA synthetase